MQYWKKDTFRTGALTAILLSVVTGVFIILVAPLISGALGMERPLNNWLIAALLPAVILMRNYFKMNFEQAGKGALVVIFAFILLFFVFLSGSANMYPVW